MEFLNILLASAWSLSSSSKTPSTTSTWDLISYIVPGVLVLLTLIFGGVAAKYAAKRLDELRKIAAKHKMQFIASSKSMNPDFEQFKIGGARRTENTLIGPVRGHVIQTGDFYYETYETDDKGRTRTEQHTFSYCWAKTPEALFVDVMIRREGILDKMKSAVGSEDINFESAEFSRKFYVTSLDRKFAYDVVCPRMMEFLLQNSGYTIYLNYTGLLVLSGSSTWNASDFPEAIQFATGFLERIPAHVWDSYKSNQPAAIQPEVKLPAANPPPAGTHQHNFEP